MKHLICVIIVIVITLAVGREGISIWQVNCQDHSVVSYLAYEGDVDYENSICN